MGWVVWILQPFKVKHFFKMLKNAGNWPFLPSTESQLFGNLFSKGCHSKMNWDLDMKPKAYEAQNTNFSEHERSSLISSATSEILKFENRTSVIIKISRFSGHRCPGINVEVFDWTYLLKAQCSTERNWFLIQKVPLQDWCI